MGYGELTRGGRASAHGARISLRFAGRLGGFCSRLRCAGRHGAGIDGGCRNAQRHALDTDGDAVVLKSVEQGVHQRLVVEQLVPVGIVQVRRNDRTHAPITLVHQTEEGVDLFCF